MKTLIFTFIALTMTSAHAVETEGECATKAIQESYKAMMTDVFASTSKSTPIFTFFFDMKTVSSKLTKKASVADNNGNIYSVVIKDNSTSQDLEFTVEFTTTDCGLKSAFQNLSGEE